MSCTETRGTLQTFADLYVRRTACDDGLRTFVYSRIGRLECEPDIPLNEAFVCIRGPWIGERRECPDGASKRDRIEGHVHWTQHWWHVGNDNGPCVHARPTIFISYLGVDGARAIVVRRALRARLISPSREQSVAAVKPELKPSQIGRYIPNVAE